MTDRELMQQALEAAPLSEYSKADRDFYKWWYGHMLNDLMQPPLNEVGYRVARYIWDAALRERLAQPEQEQEPVLYVDLNLDRVCTDKKLAAKYGLYIPLYANPQSAAKGDKS